MLLTYKRNGEDRGVRELYFTPNLQAQELGQHRSFSPPQEVLVALKSDFRPIEWKPSRFPQTRGATAGKLVDVPFYVVFIFVRCWV